MTKLLIISPDIVDSYMAGPGIRAWELARALSAHVSVILAVPNEPRTGMGAVDVRDYSASRPALRELARSADVLLVQGFTLHDFPFLEDLNKPIVVDLYDPFVIENLEVHSFRGMPERHRVHSRDLNVLIGQLTVGDFFICASERQRDYWLGMLSATGRINPHNYRRDKSLCKLIDVVPFGLPDRPPQSTGPALKGVHPGISKDDKVIIWGGGIWAWLDPVTLIEAMARISPEMPGVKLFFMGKDHPNAEISAVMGGGRYAEAVRASKDLGLFSRVVFFNSQWVEYEKRQNYLLEADLGVSLHQEFVEMRYAFRTRLLDYLWCGLPTVCSRGDSWSEVIEDRGLGRTVSCGSVGEVAEALKAMLSDPDLRNRLEPRFAEVAAQHRWSESIKPLVDFLADPQSAPDSQAARTERQ